MKDKFRDVTRDYPNIDGVLAITHKSGCGTKLFGEDHLALQRVLAGYAKHPNVAAYILVGLGWSSLRPVLTLLACALVVSTLVSMGERLWAVRGLRRTARASLAAGTGDRSRR